MEQKRLRLAELAALFAAADEEDYEDSDDTGVLPGDEVKALKAKLKEAKGQAKLAKKEQRQQRVGSYLARGRRDREHGWPATRRWRTRPSNSRPTCAPPRRSRRNWSPPPARRSTRDEARRVILERLHRLLVRDLRRLSARRPARLPRRAGESARQVRRHRQGHRGQARCRSRRS